MRENRLPLMIASFMTLIAAGVGFAIRAGVLAIWAGEFGFTKSELGTITGGGLVGFGVVILAASVITDRVGFKTILLVALLLHVISAIITFAATPTFAAFGKSETYWCLYVGTFLFAVANGLCEAAINPLIAQLYPDQKTHYLNILHAGWPGGLIVGGIMAGCFVGESAWIYGLRWEIPMAFFLVPTVWYGIIVTKEAFPVSEVKAAGIGFFQMLVEFAHPILLVLLLLQACVGYVELGTDSWITNITNNILVGQGFMLFIYASSLMFILRFFAGPIVEKINPLGLLCVSSVLATIGLFSIGYFAAPLVIWISVTVYGIGKTFFWPTMLGVVGERFPRGGAMTMGAVGGAGALAAGLLGGPGIGYKQDYYASQELKRTAAETYKRYVADDENGFLFFPKVSGLNGAKVGVLTEETGGQWTPGSDLQKNVNNWRKEGNKIEDNEQLYELDQWWEINESYKDADLRPIKDANIFGGRMALKWTAVVPAIMLFCYLLLVIYFRSQGGYQTIQISSESGGTHDDGSSG